MSRIALALPGEYAIRLGFFTAFTVGFGDITPRSRSARCVSVLLAFLGLSLLGITVAVAVEALGLAMETRGSG